MEDFRVQLDFYNGPMDLLLYLVRKEELDIHDLPIARVTEQYCRYVDMLKAVDIDVAADFLVMAAWLMEIKTRMLLPASAAEGSETSAAGEAMDPRAELVRQLLAYKRFKDLAGELGEAAAAQALKYPRAGIDWKQIAGGEDEPALDLADVQVWDLFEAFGKLLSATGRNKPHQVVYDDTPIHEHQAEIMLRIEQGPAAFESFFAGRGRSQMIGLFLAMLELIRQKRVMIEQAAAFGSIMIARRQAEDEQAAPGDAETGAVHVTACEEAKPDPERKTRKRRPEDSEATGVTWIEAEDDEHVDQELRGIDQELKSIPTHWPLDPPKAADGPGAGAAADPPLSP